MSIAESILPEFEQEMAGTRKILERVPDEKLDWKAHPKSNTIKWVASHLVEIPSWVEGTLTQDSWEINPVDGEPYVPATYHSREELLKNFDAHVAAAIKCIKETPDEEFGKTWSLLSGGNAFITMPKGGVIRTWVLNHTIHHRAHLCVYLRLNDIPVPGLYGPSGDKESQ